MTAGHSDGALDETQDEGQPSFEALFEQLTAVTEQLESGELPLERSVALYEQGMRLARECQLLLTAVEQRIERLHEQYDGEVAADSEHHDNDGGV